MLFQFQYGAIGGHAAIIQQLYLQVSIPVWCDWWRLRFFPNIAPNMCFNSSMVRLVVGGWLVLTERDDEFQFQYGAIGGELHHSIIFLPVSFQFQYGAIGGIPTFPVLSITILFQFQYGAIGGDIAIYEPRGGYQFQFQYGAIGGSTGL